MRLKDYLRPDLVLTGLDASGVEGVIHQLAQHLEKGHVVPSVEEVEEGLLTRERAHTTALGHGIALPHTTVPGLDRPVLMVAVAGEPVRFGPPGGDLVKVFFVLLSPPGRENEHIKLLARICRLVRHPGFVDELHGVGTGEEAIDAIVRVDQEHV